jgi:hypothetical protein
MSAVRTSAACSLSRHSTCPTKRSGRTRNARSLAAAVLKLPCRASHACARSKARIERPRGARSRARGPVHIAVRANQARQALSLAAAALELPHSARNASIARHCARQRIVRACIATSRRLGEARTIAKHAGRTRRACGGPRAPDGIGAWPAVTRWLSEPRCIAMLAGGALVASRKRCSRECARSANARGSSKTTRIAVPSSETRRALRRARTTARK